MNTLSLREQLLAQEGLGGGFIPSSVTRRLRAERIRRRVKSGLVMAAATLSFVGAIVTQRLPELVWVQRHIIYRDSGGFTYQEHTPDQIRDLFGYGALGLLALGLVILAFLALQHGLRRRRLATIETSLGSPLEALKASGKRA